MAETLDELVEGIEGTFGREFTQLIDTAIATVNCGGREQTREEALAELRGLHLLGIRDRVCEWLVHAYLAPIPEIEGSA